MVMTTHGPRVSTIVAALGAAYSAVEAAASTNAPAGSSSSVQQVDHLKLDAVVRQTNKGHRPHTQATRARARGAFRNSGDDIAPINPANFPYCEQ